MPEITEAYIGNADYHVRKYENNGRVESISRAKVELAILELVDKMDLPIGHKLIWYQVILESSNFNGYWKSVSERLNLPDSCTKPYVLDGTLLEYEAPTKDQLEDALEEEDVYEAEEIVEEEDSQEIDDATTAASVTAPASGPPTSTPTPTAEHPAPPPSPPSSDSDSGSDISDISDHQPLSDPRQHEPIIGPPFCPRCKSFGHTTTTCTATIEPYKEWTVEDWISENSDDFVDGHDGKNNARRLFLNGPTASFGQPEPPPVEEWLQKIEVTKEIFYEVLDNRAKARAAAAADDDVCEPSSSSKPETKGATTKASSTTLKSASKPTGITKTKAAPKKREQTPAQLKTAAAKTREVVTPPATPTPPQGTKRKADSPSNDQEIDSPPPKKAKTTGALPPPRTISKATSPKKNHNSRGSSPTNSPLNGQ